MKKFEQLNAQELELVLGGEDHIEQYCYDGCGCGDPKEEDEVKTKPRKPTPLPIYE